MNSTETRDLPEEPTRLRLLILAESTDQAFERNRLRLKPASKLYGGIASE